MAVDNAHQHCHDPTDLRDVDRMTLHVSHAGKVFQNVQAVVHPLLLRNLTVLCHLIHFLVGHIMRVNNVPAVRIEVTSLQEARAILQQENVRIVAWPYDMVSPQRYVFVVGQ